MKLYDMTKAPNARRVRIFLAEKGLAVERVPVDILAGENLAPAYLAINPRGLVPTLVLDDGTAIDESVSICRYFEEAHPEPALMGRTPAEKAVIDSWQRRIEFDGFLNVGHVFRNTGAAFVNHVIPGSGPPTAQIPAVADRGRVYVAHFFDKLNARLEQSPFVAGAAYSIADITALCTVDFAKWVDLRAPEQLTALHRWYAAQRERASYGA